MARPIFAWSYSSLSLFENCPRKFWAVKIAKKVSDQNKFNKQGDDRHKIAAGYLKGAHGLPAYLQGLAPLLDKVKNAPGELLVEFEMTLTNEFVPTRWKDWDNAWVRGAADVLKVNGARATYLDWKDGKPGDPSEQIEITALLTFQHFPKVHTVVGAGVYWNFDTVSEPTVVTRQQSGILWGQYQARVAKIERAIVTDNFPPTPNGLCGYCPYRECQYNTAAQREAREAAQKGS